MEWWKILSCRTRWLEKRQNAFGFGFLLKILISRQQFVNREAALIDPFIQRTLTSHCYINLISTNCEKHIFILRTFGLP